MAWKMILGNKERTFFPFMGIVLGLAAMVAIFSLGEGGKESVKNDLSAIASNRLVIGGDIDISDLEAVENLPVVEYGFLPGANIDTYEINLQGYSSKALYAIGQRAIGGMDILINLLADMWSERGFDVMGRYHWIVVTTLVMVLAVIPAPAAGAKDEIVDIPLGDFHSIHMDGKGELRYEVTVLSGGPVDIYLCDHPPPGYVVVYKGYLYTQKMELKKEIVMNSYQPVYLVVDNSDDFGSIAKGNVTVEISWEFQEPFSVPYWIYLILAILFITITISFRIYGTKRTIPSDTEIQRDVLQVERRGRTYSGPKTSPVEAAPSGEAKWCVRCGTRMYWEAGEDWPTCPRCKR